MNNTSKLAQEEAHALDVQYEQYKKFTVKGIGNDNSDMKMIFKKASHAVNVLNAHFSVGCVTAKHFDGSSKLISEKKANVCVSVN